MLANVTERECAQATLHIFFSVVGTQRYLESNVMKCKERCLGTMAIADGFFLSTYIAVALKKRQYLSSRLSEIRWVFKSPFKRADCKVRRVSEGKYTAALRLRLPAPGSSSPTPGTSVSGAVRRALTTKHSLRGSPLSGCIIAIL